MILFPLLKLLLIGDTAKLFGERLGLQGVNVFNLLKFERDPAIKVKLIDFYEEYLRYNVI